MTSEESGPSVKLSVVVPCFNEERTLATCVRRVVEIQDSTLSVEVIVVDDGSRDRSFAIAEQLAGCYPEVRLFRHSGNQGKGAAIRTGLGQATGDFVAIQDADLEYDPAELRGLLGPLQDGKADVVIGSRFLGGTPHRVLYFWHYLGNRLLTFLSNMFTDLNLTDMETCYKVFRRETIQNIQIQENRFGFEPEIVAKVAQLRLRVYEAGISYAGRTYDEGKKVGWRDGVWALYCIFRYNAYHLPVPMQFIIYWCIGSGVALVNLVTFLALMAAGASLGASVLLAFAVAAAANYGLCIAVLFRRKARWSAGTEILVYGMVAVVVGSLDLGVTRLFFALGSSAWVSKSLASLVGLVFNFIGCRFLVFPEKTS